MNPLFLKILVQELRQELLQSWVVGVYPPAATSIFLRLSSTPQAGDSDRGLYISWDSRYPCLYLCPWTEEVKQATRRQGGKAASRGIARYAPTLKKYLLKTRIAAVQAGAGPSEVIINFRRPRSRTAGANHELPLPEASLQLFLCLTKGHPQIEILPHPAAGAPLPEGERMEVRVKKEVEVIEETKISHRKPHVFDLPHPEAVAALLHPWEEGDLVEKLMERTQGLSRLWAKELYLRAEYAGYLVDSKEVTPERLFRAIGELAFILGGPPQPRVVEKPLGDGKKQILALTPLPLIQFPLEWQRKFSTLSLAAQYYYENKTEEENRRKIREELLKVLRREEKRLDRLKQALLADQARSEAAKDYKLYGELINAQVKTEAAGQRGQERITLVNYYQPQGPSLEVPLDPTLSLRQNAQRYFRLYQKAQRGHKVIGNRLNRVEGEVKQVSTLRERAENAGELEELTGLQEELIKEGWLGKARAGLKPAAAKPVTTVSRAFHHFIAKDGYEILVGKNARENDRLTFGHAMPQDLWLHAQGFGGAHVVVRAKGPKTPVPDKTLEEAAQLAVYFSKARGKGKIKVLYTKVKEVKKPKGAKAGLVTVGRYRTIIIDTDNFNANKLTGLQADKL